MTSFCFNLIRIKWIVPVALQLFMVTYAEAIMCLQIFPQLTTEELAQSGAAQVGLIMNESKSRPTKGPSPYTKFERPLPPLEVFTVIEILKKSVGEDLLLDEVDVNVKPPWVLHLKRQTTVGHIEQVLDLFSLSVEGFRSSQGDDAAEVLIRVQHGLRETLAATLSQLTPVKKIEFATRVERYLKENIESYWDMKAILTHLGRINIANETWVLMLTRIFERLHNDLKTSSRRDEIAEMIELMIRNSLVEMKAISKEALEDFIVTGMIHRILLVALLKSNIAIPQSYHDEIAQAVSTIWANDIRSVGVGYLFAKELLRRRIALKQSVRFVQKILESEDSQISESTKRLFQQLKDNNIEFFK